MKKPKVLCSACLEHCKCRYDGSVIESSMIKLLQNFVTFETVCPEMGIGLPSPREAVRLIKTEEGLLLKDSYTGTDRTKDMKSFINTFFENHQEEDYDAVILKCKSPTCGLKEVKLYSDVGKRPSLTEKSHGLFGGSILEHFSKVPIEDEGRLKHFNIREQFYMAMFLRFSFRQVKEEVMKTQKLGALVNYHTENKYLFMAYSQETLKNLGAIVANHKHAAYEEVLKEYEDELSKVYRAQLTPGKNVNMLLHVFGYFKNDLSADEKTFFLEQLGLYEQKKLPFSSVLMIIQSWVVRYNQAYLKKQTIFNLFPKELVEMTDSGKGL